MLKALHLQVHHCSRPCHILLSHNSPERAPFDKAMTLSNTIEEADATRLKSLNVSVNLQCRAELERHASQHIIATHQQQSFAINFLQHKILDLTFFTTILCN